MPKKVASNSIFHTHLETTVLYLFQETNKLTGTPIKKMSGYKQVTLTLGKP